jgi:four helix bundle protein
MSIFANAPYRKSRFRVKKPIRSFRDLEVYQRASACATEILTKAVPMLEEKKSPIRDKMVETVLRIPEAIAEAHSQRFERGDENKFIEDALKECNKAVVYLEQARDIYLKDTEGTALCEDLIKRYILLRRKVFNLYKAWRQFGSYGKK